MKRTFHLFSVAVVLTLIISLVQVTSVPARGWATPTPIDPGSTPTQVGDPGPTPTPIDPGPTPTQFDDPGPTPTPIEPGPTPTQFDDPGPTPTPIEPGPTPTQVVDPDSTSTPFIDPGPTPTPFLPPGSTPTPLIPPVSQPAVLSIVRANPSPTTARSVDFIVTFSEPVMGVDVQDFAVKTAGWIKGATVSKVNSLGNVYTVTVKTGKGTGTLRLDVPVNVTITNLAGAPLGVLPFQRGEVYIIWKGWR